MQIIDKSSPDYVYKPIVYAIQKAVSEEIPIRTSELNLATENYKIYIRGDIINTILRSVTSGDNQFFIRFFKRSGWEAALLFDTVYKRVFFITTDNTLESYNFRKKEYPHFSQTLVKVLNSDLKGKYYTEYLFEELSPELYDYDLNYLDKSFKSSGIDIEGYHFYYITYTVQFGSILKIRSLLLNSEFGEVENRNLIEFLDVDYYSVAEEVAIKSEEQDITEDSRNLVKLKNIDLTQAKECDLGN